MALAATSATSSMYGLSTSSSNQSRNILAQNRGRERPEAFAIFDLKIEVLLHAGVRGSARIERLPERARPEFHAALKPADRLAVGKRLRRRLHQSSARR